MPELYIDCDESEYVSGDYNITVRKESYQGFRMFQKIRYEDKDKIPFNYFSILDKKKQIIIMYDYESRKVYRREFVEYVEIFVHISNPYTPLVIKVCITGNYKYYRLSKIKHNKRFQINNLTDEFIVSGKLSDYLINENDIINKKATFRVEKKDRYNNITVDKEENNDDYVVYKHTPLNNYKSFQSYVLYKNIPFRIFSDKKDERNIINDIKDIKFQSLNAYYQKNHDEKDVPLLVEFIDSDNKSHYFSRKNQYESYWTKDYIKKPNESIKDKIESIYFLLNNSIIVFINKKTQYSSIPYKKINESPSSKKRLKRSLEIDLVTPQKISDSNDCNYDCYKHILNNHNLSKEFVVNRLFISSEEIELYDNDGQQDYLLYSDDKNNICVYFYKDDYVPLMVKFDGKWYGPQSKKTYFKKWTQRVFINTHKSDCIFSNLIQTELDKINMMLNEVNIYKISDYGIDDNFYPEIDDQQNDHICNNEKCEKDCIKKTENSIKTIFDTTRIIVSSMDYNIFKVFTHRTKNNFKIGNIVYDSSIFKLNKSGTNHINIEENTVSVFYFNYNLDTNPSNPLLVSLKSDPTKIKYFKISNSMNVSVDHLQLDIMNDFKIHKNGLDEFLEHQNYLLNKVICVNLDKKKNYKCCEFQNKYVHHTIIVKNVQIGEGLILNKNNYDTYSHYLEDIEGSFNENDILLEKIAYSDEFKTKVKINHFKIGNHVIKLKSFYRHIENPLFTIKVAYVHFYGNDPRPLLVYCNNVGFAPKTMEEYYKNWDEVDNINYTRRGDGNHNLISVKNKLDEICYYLNPVDVSKIENYIIHKHPSDKSHNVTISVKVDRKVIPGYVKINHKASEGFRLGLVKYKQHKLFQNYDDCTYKTSEMKEVIVYYYEHDSEYKYPLLIELGFDYRYPNQYYVLFSTHPYEWRRTAYGILDKNENNLDWFLWNVNYQFNSDMIAKFEPENLYDENIEYDYSSIEHTYNGKDSGFDEYGTDYLTEAQSLAYNYKGYEFRPPVFELRFDEYNNATSPKMLDIHFQPQTGANTSESESSKLPGILGGVFCSLGAVGGSGFLVYKYFLKGMVFDMRPFF